MRLPKSTSLVSLLPFAGATGLTAFVGSRSTRHGLPRWYEDLEKPPFQPPARVFAPVWSTLYGLISVSGWRVYRAPPSRARTRALALWGTQLVLNGAWSRLFFSRHRARLALADCAGLLALASTYAAVARRVERNAAALFAPYIAWLGFALLLNEEIVRRNPSA